VTREELENRIEEAATRFAETQDRSYLNAVVRLTVQLAELRNIEVLTHAVGRCRNEDIRTDEVDHALDFLEHRAKVKWPFEQFRKALSSNGHEDARYQVLNASLNAIRQALGLA
jgi:hypothetical protein